MRKLNIKVNLRERDLIQATKIINENTLDNLENSKEFEGYTIAARLDINNQIFIGGGGQFSKIENGKYIEICNWLKPVYNTKAKGHTSLFDVLFDGNLYHMSLTKNKKCIQFDNYNSDEYRDTKYDFINNIFYVKSLKSLGNLKDDFELESLEALKEISRIEKNFKIKLSGDIK
jgi:hypothetical protein